MSPVHLTVHNKSSPRTIKLMICAQSQVLTFESIEKASENVYYCLQRRRVLCTACRWFGSYSSYRAVPSAKWLEGGWAEEKSRPPSGLIVPYIGVCNITTSTGFTIKTSTSIFHHLPSLLSSRPMTKAMYIDPAPYSWILQQQLHGTVTQ